MKAWLLFLPSLLAACSNSAGDRDAYQRGLSALEEGDPRTARIEFLNAIKADPANKAARIMQARTYLALGDGIAAQSEIERARTLGYPVAETRVFQAHALLLQGRPAEALKELQASSGPYADRIRGRAFADTDDPARAAAAFESAITLAPRDAELWIDVARFRRAQGELAGALTAADQAVASDPQSVNALIIRGELTRTQYGLRASLPWFDRALEIDKDHVVARLEKAATLGDMGEMRAMLAETRAILALAPRNPMAFYLQSMLAARARKYDLARSLFERTEGKLDGQPAAMLLEGAIDVQTGRTGQAAGRLARLVALQPDNRKARRLLAAAYWRDGNAKDTVATLQPVADQPDAGSYELSLMGQALVRMGDRDAGSRYLARAAQPQQRQGNALLTPTADPARIDQLRAQAQASPDDAGTQVALIRALLSVGLGREALERATALQKTHPGVPDAHIMVGDALAIQGRFDMAADQYRKAANIAFTEPVALRMIEALQRSDQQAAAGRVLGLFLDQNPTNVSAQLLFATQSMAAGRWRQAITYYERLRRQLGDRDAVMLNNLAWCYGEIGDYDRALPLARKAWALDRNNPATADTFGWLLFKSGKDKARGLVLLEQAVRGAPGDSQIRAHLAAARGA